jgi:phage FluMu protein gp41
MQRRPDNETNVDVQPHTLDDRYFDGVPEAFYRGPPHSAQLMATSSVQANQDDSMANLSGYELLAARLTNEHNIEHPFRPLYRKFTRLNHRILLQLQDEISQMEADLASLDAADAKSRRGSTGQMVPESRRLSWQWHASELQARRLELLGQIYIKIEQYSKVVPVGALQSVRN